MSPAELTGQDLASRGAQVAADHADRTTAGQWTAMAMDFFNAWAQARQGRPFQGEDVRLAAVGVVPAPPDARAWGLVLRRAARAGLIHRVGFAPVKDRRSHCGPKAVWELQGPLAGDAAQAPKEQSPAAQWLAGSAVAEGRELTSSRAEKDGTRLAERGYP